LLTTYKVEIERLEWLSGDSSGDYRNVIVEKLSADLKSLVEIAESTAELEMQYARMERDVVQFFMSLYTSLPLPPPSVVQPLQ